MSMEGLVAVHDPHVADWIAPRLGGDPGAVRGFVPGGFAAYARVLHPVDPAPHDEPTTWAGVCARTGRVPHASLQWERIAGADPDLQVLVGTLAPDALARLLEVLAPFTGTQDCHHALWEGFGWLTGASCPFPPVPRLPRPAVLEDALAAPRSSLAMREYLHFRGPLRAAANLGEQVTPDWFLPQSPNLLWPLDRSWFLATEVDLDSTLVGGPGDLVDALVSTRGLEVWRVDADDDLSSEGDQLNR